MIHKALAITAGVLTMVVSLQAQVPDFTPQTSRSCTVPKGVRLVTDLSPHLPVVSGDYDRLLQVAWNLVANGVKFTDSGGLVTIRVAALANSVSLSVADTGIGIAPDVLPHEIAQFLRGLSRDGSRQVTFKATAMGTRFYFEETGGVTVYRFTNGQYVRQEFLPGSTLAKAVKKYAK